MRQLRQWASKMVGCKVYIPVCTAVPFQRHVIITCKHAAVAVVLDIQHDSMSDVCSLGRDSVTAAAAA